MCCTSQAHHQVLEKGHYSTISFNSIDCAILSFSQLHGEMFMPHPRRQGYDCLIDLKFGTGNYWHKTIKNAEFHKINCYIPGDLTS